MLTGKQVAIFDLDGTLIDSIGIWNAVDQRLLKTLDNTATLSTSTLQQQRDAALRRYRQAANPYLEYCRELKVSLGSPLTAEAIYQIRYDLAREYLIHHIDYKKQAAATIKALHARGLTLVIATTTKRANIDIYRTQNQNIIRQAPFDDYFSLIYTREDVSEIKPHPEIYNKVLATLQVLPAACIVFEDSLIGIEAAKQAGIETIAMYDAYSAHEQGKIQSLADYQFDDFRQVLTVIKTCPFSVKQSCSG